MKRVNQLVLISMLSLFFGTIKAQNDLRNNLPSIINASGGYGIVNRQMYDFSIGETVLTETFSGIPDYLFSQGFMQPYLISISSVKDVIVESNVMTPNGDGKNDVFVVRGLEKYLGSKLGIYDRAGRISYNATDYKSNWNGTLNGNTLNEDSYFYVIDFGNDRGLIRGFISIILD